MIESSNSIFQLKEITNQFNYKNSYISFHKVSKPIDVNSRPFQDRRTSVLSDDLAPVVNDKRPLGFNNINYNPGYDVMVKPIQSVSDVSEISVTKKKSSD